MTDESNGESGFEFVEKKPEDFSHIGATSAAKIDTSNAAITTTLATNVTSPTTTQSLLSTIAPPSDLPIFVVHSLSASASSPSNQSQEKSKSEDPKSATESQKLIQNVELNTSSNNMPNVLIAPDSPEKDNGALAGGLFTWVKDAVANSNVLSKVAEKAKSSVNSMITTLDPQMREFIYSGGDIEIIVASDKESKVAPVREAFQNVFGNATVNGTKVETSFEAAQPIGFAAGVKAAQERIASVRSDTSISADIPVIAVENFLLEVDHNKWYDLGVIILEDAKQNISLQTFTQMTPVPSQIVETAQESTPDNYSKDGLAVTIGSLMGANLQVPHSEWHSALTGVSRKDMIFLAAQSLAGIYKNTINPV